MISPQPMSRQLATRLLRATFSFSCVHTGWISWSLITSYRPLDYNGTLSASRTLAPVDCEPMLTRRSSFCRILTICADEDEPYAFLSDLAFGLNSEQSSQQVILHLDDAHHTWELSWMAQHLPSPLVLTCPTSRSERVSVGSTFSPTPMRPPGTA